MNRSSRRSRSPASFLAPTAALVIGAIALGGGPFAIDRYTIECGGARSAGGPFDLVGTIGQLEPGPVAAGGSYVLRGGFWNALPPCPGDLNGDGMIDGADLGLLLGMWGPAPGSPADLNGDGMVDGADLGLLLGLWGPCP